MIIWPPPRPVSRPILNCCAKDLMTATAAVSVPAPEAMISTRVIVKKIAIGSFDPDSTSSVQRTRSRMVMPPTRSRKNTAAASVGLTIAPSNRAGIHGRSSR